MTDPDTTSEQARILAAARAFLAGDEGAAHTLLPFVYAELRNVAAGVLGGTVNGTVSPTVLVHEAFAKLSGRRDLEFASPGAFFGFTAKVMRCVLVDHARAARAQKRGGPSAFRDEVGDPGGWRERTLSGLAELGGASERPGERDDMVLSLNDALDELASLSERRARVVELRFFAGLEEQQIAEVLGVSRTTVSTDWRFARAWLLKRLAER